MTQKVFTKALGFAVAMAIVTPLAASAQGRFNGLDRNGDGVVTRAEWRGNDQSFRNQDRNGDGVLSGAELNRGSSVLVPVWWGYDVNRDGRISRGEWPGVAGDFDVLDRNNDGWLSRDEVNRGHSVRQGDGRGDNDKNKPAKVKPNKPVKAKPAKPAKPGRGRGHGKG